MEAAAGTATAQARRRVPAAERREELIAAAVHEFAHGGLHGTPVERIARRVGVAQPYVFSLFPSKRELFLAALCRGHPSACLLGPGARYGLHSLKLAATNKFVKAPSEEPGEWRRIPSSP